MLAVNFTASLLFHLPYANNTQRFNVVQTPNSQYWEALNFDNVSVDNTLVTAGKGYYTRTEKDHQSCIAADPVFTVFQPKLQDFEYQGEVFLDQRKMSHYRFIDEAIVTSENQTYYSAAQLQQEFYCVQKGDFCIPYRWEMRSRSNFDSHTDLYIIDYLSYDLRVDQSKFEVSDMCAGVSQPRQRNHAFSRFNDLLNFKTNVQHAEKFIQGLRANKNLTFTVGHNRFSFFSARQRKMDSGKHIPRQEHHDKPAGKECNIPSQPTTETIDWRARGLSTPVRDQVACGSCWAFAAAGALEGRINTLRRLPDLVKLSEQYIVDCFWDKTPSDPFIWSQGCEGGQPYNALKWFNGTKMTLLKDYPYLGQNDYCKPEKATYDDYIVMDVCQVPQTIEQLKLALMGSPIAVTIDVTEAMSFYTGGVFNDPSCKSAFEDLVHNVLAVGYGTDEEYGDYWIIKNSWSNNWGIDGYIYISMADNLCGILTDASYPRIGKYNKAE